MLYPRSRKPLFEQLKDIILKMIEEGKYKPGDLLPSEREFAEQYGISRVTVRQTLSELVHSGVVYKRHGKGNYVAAKRVETKLDSLLGFVEEFTVQGMDYEVSVISQGYGPAPSDAFSALQLQNDPEVFSLVRQIKVKGQALGVAHTYIPKSVAYQLDMVDFNKVIVYRLFEQQGYKLTSAEQTITAEMPSAQHCGLLRLEANIPVLVRCRVAYVEGNLPISYCKAFYRGDRYHYTLTLNRYSTDNLDIENIEHIAAPK